MSGLLQRLPRLFGRVSWEGWPRWPRTFPGIVLQFLREFWFPPVCPGCDRNLPSDAAGACETCLRQLREQQSLQPLRQTCSERCAVCFTLREADVCSYCSSRRVFFDGHWSARPMQGLWREALHRWKFENDRRLWGLFWSLCIGPAILERCRRIGIERIVWIDSGPAGRQVRNYQPCADVARAFAVALDLPGGCGPDLRKKRRGEQSAQRYAERFFSVYDSLEYRGEGKATSYLLIEDVFTTGATANEAARVLKKNGAFHVFVISLLLRDGDGG